MSGVAWNRSWRWQTTVRGPVCADVSVWCGEPYGFGWFWTVTSWRYATGDALRTAEGTARSLTEAKRKALSEAAGLQLQGIAALGGGQ